jgi:hypothetical protein
VKSESRADLAKRCAAGGWLFSFMLNAEINQRLVMLLTSCFLRAETAFADPLPWRDVLEEVL